mmetsp:Transcript_18406/g.25949  ORF Transcript_18406/g.25949 Transcript_18406/m.25949 type:complete len:216 (-) Transcript_18406:7-654(-)
MIGRTSTTLARVVGRNLSSQLSRSAVMATATTAASSNWSNIMTSTVNAVPKRSMVSVAESSSAHEAWEKSCYVAIDFTIPDDHLVFEAVQRFAAYNIGCLITTGENGEITGVVSERDYIKKVALMGKISMDTKIKEISTKTDNLITASPGDTVDECMEKMLTRGIRHLPILDDSKKVIGMLSIKDCIKATLEERNRDINMLSNFACGRGGTMVVD